MEETNNAEDLNQNSQHLPKTSEFELVLDKFEFENVFLGTGLVESVLAASLSKKHLSQLVLDLDHTYSSSLKTVNLKELISLNNKNNQKIINDININNENQFITTEIHKSSNLCMFRQKSYLDKSVLDTSAPEQMGLQQYKYFNIDLQPKLIASQSLTVDIMQQAEMDKYMEFQAIQEMYFYDNKNQRLMITPNSKGDIFKHPDLSLLEKRALFKLMQILMSIQNQIEHIQIDVNSVQEFDREIEDKDEYFKIYQQFQDKICIDFLAHFTSSQIVQQIFLYNLANYEYDIHRLKDGSIFQNLNLNSASGQCSTQKHQTIQQFEYQFTTKAMIERIYQYIKSLGVHSQYSYLYTNYGTGDIPQGFSRIASVFGTLYVISPEIKISSIIQNSEGTKQDGNQVDAPEQQKGKFKYRIFTNLAGQQKRFIECNNIICGQEYDNSFSQTNENVFNLYLYRQIIILSKSDESQQNSINDLKCPQVSVIPPGCLALQNVNPITIIILNSTTQSVPQNKFVVHIKMALPVCFTQQTLQPFSDEQLDQIMNNFEQFVLSTYVPLNHKQNNYKVDYTCRYLQKRSLCNKSNQNFEAQKIDSIYQVIDDSFDITMDSSFQQFKTLIKEIYPSIYAKDDTQKQSLGQQEAFDYFQEINLNIPDTDNYIQCNKAELQKPESQSNYQQLLTNLELLQVDNKNSHLSLSENTNNYNALEIKNEVQLEKGDNEKILDTYLNFNDNENINDPKNTDQNFAQIQENEQNI